MTPQSLRRSNPTHSFCVEQREKSEDIVSIKIPRAFAVLIVLLALVATALAGSAGIALGQDGTYDNSQITVSGDQISVRSTDVNGNSVDFMGTLNGGYLVLDSKIFSNCQVTVSGDQMAAGCNDASGNPVSFNATLNGASPAPDQEPVTTNGGLDTSCVGDPTMAAHWARLRQLDPVFRTSGWQAWLSAAGVTWDSIDLLSPSIQKDARQVEEETDPTIQPLASGIQIRGSGINIPWPNVLTTDRPNEVTTTPNTVIVQTTNNLSALYGDPDGVILNGQGTIWIDGSNWGQFASVFGCGNGSATAVAPVDTVPQVETPPAADLPSGRQPSANNGDWCFTERQLDQKYGIDRNAQGADNGLLKENGRYEGAVIHVTKAEANALNAHGWTVTGTNPTIKSAWNPKSCRK